MCLWVFTGRTEKLSGVPTSSWCIDPVDHRKYIPLSHMSLPVIYSHFKNSLAHKICEVVCALWTKPSTYRNKIKSILCICEDISSWWWCVACDTIWTLELWALLQITHHQQHMLLAPQMQNVSWQWDCYFWGKGRTNHILTRSAAPRHPQRECIRKYMHFLTAFCF